MGIGIVAHDQIRFGQVCGHVLCEKALQHRNAKRPGRRRRAFGWLNPKTADASGYEVFQQIAVVGGHLEYMTVTSQPKPLDDHVHISLGVIQPALRC